MGKLLVGLGEQVTQRTRTIKAKKAKALGLGGAVDSPYMQTVKVREAQLISNNYAKRDAPGRSARSPSLGNRTQDKAETERTDAKAWQKELYQAPPAEADWSPE